MRLVMLWGALVLVSCREEAVKGAVSTLTTSPGALDFGRVTVGARRELVLALEGRAQGTLTVGAPFALDDTSFAAPSERRVSFAPQGDGVFSAHVELVSEAGVLLVAVSGEGVSPTECSSADACVSSSWSDEEARCVATRLAEGAACAAACVSNGHCQGGLCVGTAVGCDDGDACTVDACDPASGCVHAPRECGDSANPCLASRCEGAGCVTSQVEDGVACGPRDCSTARVCLSGQCVERSVPEGSACGAASVCRAAGLCTGGSCVQPPAQLLQLAWSHSTAAFIDFPGLADADGNLFWFECSATPPCTLVSVTADGVPRFEVATSFQRLANPYMRPTPATLAGELLLFAKGGELEARRRADGALVWKSTLPTRAQGSLNQAREVMGLAAHLPDALYVAAAFFPDWMGGEYEPAVSRLDLRTGQLDWDQRAGRMPLAGASIPQPSVVVDATGQPVVAGYYGGGIGSTRGYSAQGALRWSTSNGAVAVTDVIGERVFHSNYGWFDARGQAHGVPRFQNTMFPVALSSAAGVVLVGVTSPRIELMNESSGWQKVPLLDFGSWPPRITTPRLSATGAVSFAHHSGTGPVLRDFSTDGRALLACPFVVTAGQTLDTSQPVVELPGKMVLVDSGRKVVWAFRR